MRPKRITVAWGGALVAAAIVGVVVTLAVRGNPGPAAPGSLPSTTALVVRTDLSSTVLTAGTLDYAPSAPIVNRMAGTYTWLQTLSTEIAPGQVLYKVDNQPVVLMAGTVPAWRSFASGMTDGPDVGQLEAGLLVAGDARGLFSVATNHFSAGTATAVRRWQTAMGLPVTGQIALGTIVFLPGPIRVDAQQVSPGQAASPGDQPYVVSTNSRVVTVPLNANLPTVTPGQAVSILLPDGSNTPGRATSIVAVPSQGGQSGQSGGSGGGGSSNSSSSSAPIDLIVTPNSPAATGTTAGVPVQVTLTVQSVKNVLAVPVPALLALAGGGYGLEVVTHSGTHELVGVRTGVFAGGRVQITGAGIEPGVRVVVAQ
jgi:peptidoglycan hydrolase-like protein with peptidoglycan-binding domain